MHYTLGDRIRDVGGYSSGFDYMRLGLAVAVLYGHSFLLTGDASPLPAGLRWLDGLRFNIVLPMFFCLSGFLVAASLERVRSLPTFMALRAIRIGPALAVEIALSALILGPVLTTRPLGQYFADPQFHRYFLNAAGWIHYTLPGVFAGNHVPGIVNGSLWTVPYEAECYLLLAALAAVGALRYPRMMAVAVMLVCAALLVYFAVEGDPQPSRGTATGRQLVIFFLSGVLLYRLRDDLPFSGWAALAAFGVCALTIQSHVLIYVCPFCAAYFTGFLGLLRPRKLPVLFTGDYSYGIYLYAYPIQQALFQASPWFRTWWGNCVGSLILVACFAAFSWHAIEKPALRLKRFVLRRRGRPQPVPGQLIGSAAREGAALRGAP